MSINDLSRTPDLLGRTVPAEWTDQALDDLWDLLQARLGERIDDAREALVQNLIDWDIVHVIMKHRHIAAEPADLPGVAWNRLSNEWLRAYHERPSIHFKRRFFPAAPDPKEMSA